MVLRALSRAIPAGCLLVGAVIPAPPAAAQVSGAVPAGAKVAVVDIQRVFEESTAGQAALERLRQLGEENQAEFDRRRQEVQDLRQRIVEGSLSLSDERRAELERQLEDAQRSLARFQEDATAELQRSEREALEEFRRKLLPVIDEVGKEQGFTLIFDKFNSGLVFAQEQVDITNLIIQRFNARSAPSAGGEDGGGS